MRSRLSVLALSMAVLLSFVFACVEKNKDSEHVSIRLKWLHQAQFAGFYYAKEAGLYKKKGLQVDLLPGGVDSPAIQLVASGSNQFGVTGADQIIIARSKGIPVVAVACIYQRSPFVLFSLKGSGISRVEDFLGKKVGVKLGGNEELTYRAMLGKAGIDASRLTEIPVKFDISPLLTKQVDVWPGYSINEPILAEEKGFPVTLIWPDSYGVHLYADVLFTTEEILRARPAMVKDVVQATVNGWGQAFKDRDQAVAYTLKYGNQLTREHERKMLDASFPLVEPSGSRIGDMKQSIWEEMQVILRNAKFIDRDIDLSKAYRTDLLLH